MKLSDMLDYCPSSGKFTWLISRGRVKRGSAAGSLNSEGYLEVQVYGKKVKAHRLAWEFIKGEIPEGMQIDHINHMRDDNRLSNLRLVSQGDNLRNKSFSKANSSGRCGVSWHKTEGKWHARITYAGKEIFLGRFSDFEAACNAREAAELKYGFHSNHGKRAAKEVKNV